MVSLETIRQVPRNNIVLGCKPVPKRKAAHELEEAEEVQALGLPTALSRNCNCLHPSRNSNTPKLCTV